MSERTVAEVYDAVLDVKTGVIETQAEVVEVKGELILLRQHVNHEVELLTGRINRQDDALADKVDKTSLLSSLGVRIVEVKWVRWALGILAAAVLTTAALNWGEVIDRIVRSF